MKTKEELRIWVDENGDTRMEGRLSLSNTAWVIERMGHTIEKQLEALEQMLPKNAGGDD